MKAVILRRSGNPDVLKPEEIPDPTPGSNELMVRLEYAGMNYAEILSRKGLYGWSVKRPYILGMEGVGVIEEVGSGVDPSRIGDRVITGGKYGMYAEKVVVKENRVVPALDSFTTEENAAFLVNYLTASIALFEMGRLKHDDKVLITAAAGGVGTAAVQLASAFGCNVYGMAGSDEKIELIRSLGARDGFNYSEDNAFELLMDKTGGVDVVIELVGGDIYRNCRDSLRPFGRVVIIGFASLDLKKWNPLSWVKTWRDIPRAKVGDMAERSTGVLATHIGHLFEKEPEIISDSYKKLTEFVVEQNIRPVVGRVFNLDEVSEAHRYMESRNSMGKVLLKI